MKQQKRNLKDLGIDKTWTLFLDRDGVINQRIADDYVKDWTQFVFLPFVMKAIRILSEIFGRIVVVTNQRGVARNLMRDSDLADIHKKMVDALRKAGGRIDCVYACPHDLSAHCSCRKPKTGLAMEAKRDFPSIVFVKSVMIGDDNTDMIFARKLGMKSVLIKNNNRSGSRELMADFVYRDLLDFALALEHQ